MSDTYKVIKCPACGATMTKIFVPSQGVSIDICDNGCGGIYFDNRELDMFKNCPEANTKEILELFENKVFNKIDEDLPRICPNCSTRMVKNTIANSTVQIDSCYACGGIFLDYGELNLIRDSLQKYHSSKPQQLATNSSEINLSDFYRDACREESVSSAAFDALDVTLRILGLTLFPRSRRHNHWF